MMSEHCAALGMKVLDPVHTDDSVSTSLQPAYILHYRQWQESSFIVDAFTLTHGRIALVAKSARASKPRVRALYQPFRPLLLSWVGGSDLRTLTGIEESGQPITLEDASLACGYYFNELILRLLGKDQPQPEIFAHYALALSELTAPDARIEIVLRTFELQLLDTLGVLPDLAQSTADGSTVDAARQYRYHPANAVAVVTAQSSDEPGSQRYAGIQKEKVRMGESDTRNPGVQADGITADKGVLVSGSTLLALSRLDLQEASVRAEAKVLMRHILRVHLGEKPLQSRELFESLVRR